jgi:hypothetical protein
MASLAPIFGSRLIFDPPGPPPEVGNHAENESENMKITFNSPESLAEWVRSNCTICGSTMRGAYPQPLLDSVTLHLLDDTREYVGRFPGLHIELARYLAVSSKSVQRWLRREKMPLQATLDAIAQWRRVKKAGL